MPDKKNGKESKSLTPTLAENVSGLAEDFNRRISDISGAVNTVTSNVSRGAEAAGNLRASIRDVVGDVFRLRGANKETENTVQATVDPGDLHWLDLVVEAGMVDNREQAASLFISQGVKARLPQLKLIEQKVRELRQEQG